MYDRLGDAIVGGFIVMLLVGIAIGAFLFWLLPLLWTWVKPWIHAITG
jgi:hypothetical protein